MQYNVFLNNIFSEILNNINYVYIFIKYHCYFNSLLYIVLNLRQENEAKCRFGWRLVKSALRDGVSVTNNADVKRLQLTHGLRRSRNVEFVRPVTDIQYNSTTQVSTARV